MELQWYLDNWKPVLRGMAVVSDGRNEEFSLADAERRVQQCIDSGQVKSAEAMVDAMELAIRMSKGRFEG